MEHAETTALAAAALAKRELGPLEKPRGEAPVLDPDYLTVMGDEDLTILMARFTLWADYSQTQLALYAVDENTAKTLLERARAIALVTVSPSGKRDDTVTLAKAVAEEQDEFIERYRNALMTAYAFRKIVEGRFESYVRDASIVSREQTRREKVRDEPAGRRVGRRQ